MKIYTRHENEKIERPELKFAAEFMLGFLLSEKERQKLVLTIESLYPSTKTWHGFTIVTNSELHKRKPSRFRIQLNATLSKKQQLIALAHELVHVKQFSRNELGSSFIMKAGKFTEWKKKLINENEQGYYELPWEIEANGREYGLWRRYDNLIKLIKKEKALQE